MAYNHDNFFDNHDNSCAHCCDQDGYRPDGSKVIYDYKQVSKSLTTCHQHYDDHALNLNDHANR